MHGIPALLHLRNFNRRAHLKRPHPHDTRPLPNEAAFFAAFNLAHVHEVADRLVVLDLGRIVSEISPKQMSVLELTEYLIEIQHKQ